MVKDLVCGMMVDKASPPAKTNYKGKEYYFCSKHCKEEFEKNPEQYLKKNEEGAGEENS
ncbi:MAG: YHS domain-containing protein [Calditrichaeota bacterium]|nr:MAG: YHS domain-containing protein [Calditrichota bacterium]